MPRPALAVLVGLLAVVAGVAGAAPVPVPSSPSQASVASPVAPNVVRDTAIMTLSSPGRTSITTQSLDVAAAVAIQRDTAAARLDRYVLVTRFERAVATQARRELLIQATTAVEITASQLRSERRALWLAYVNRTIDTHAFVRRSLRLAARAESQRAKLDLIRRYADDIPRFSVRLRASNLGVGLLGFDGRVLDRTARAVNGTAPPTRVYVSVSPEGVVYATISDRRYVRQAYRTDRRDDDIGGIGLDQAIGRVVEFYPTAYNDSIRRSVSSLGSDTYRIELELRVGSVTAYLDSGTRDVFYEIQTRNLDVFQPGPAVETVENDTRLVVNRTYPGGPLRVAVSGPDGAPVTATVVVAGQPLETGPDGVLWTLAPRGRTRITAVRPGGNATIAVGSTSPATLNASG